MKKQKLYKNEKNKIHLMNGKNRILPPPHILPLQNVKYCRNKKKFHLYGIFCVTKA